MMQGVILDPFMFLFFIIGFCVLLVVFTYETKFSKNIKAFVKPKTTTVFGMLTLVFLGMVFGIFVLFSVFTGDLNIIGHDFLFNNIYMFVFVIGFMLSFGLMLGYIYIYRGGA